MNWKGCDTNSSWPNLRYYLGICLQRLKSTTKNLGEDSGSLARYLNPEPPAYEAEVVMTVVTVILLLDSGPYTIMFMTVYLLLQIFPSFNVHVGVTITDLPWGTGGLVLCLHGTFFGLKPTTGNEEALLP
jgi:hypothetical protein